MESKEQKREAMQGKINEVIDSILSLAEKQDKLDYFNITINNHHGNLKMDYMFSDMKKAY